MKQPTCSWHLEGHPPCGKPAHVVMVLVVRGPGAGKVGELTGAMSMNKCSTPSRKTSTSTDPVPSRLPIDKTMRRQSLESRRANEQDARDALGCVVGLRPNLQEVAPIRNGAYRDNDQPRLKRIKAKRAKRPVRHNWKNHCRQQQKLRERQDFVARHSLGKALECRLQLKQCDAKYCKRGRDPILLVGDERSEA